MIIKKKEIPITLLKLAGLTNRSDPNHLIYQTIVDDLNIYQSGYRGELAFDYYLRAIDSNHYGILHSHLNSLFFPDC